MLAGFRNTRCAKSEDEIAKALQGNYKPEHLFVLKQSVDQYDFYHRQIQECDAEMEAMYADYPPSESDDQGWPTTQTEAWQAAQEPGSL